MQAAAIKARMARELGPFVGVWRGRARFAGASRLARLESFPGLTGRKVEYLRHLAGETAAGKLDAAHLRSLPVDEVLERLKDLPGIGDFSAELNLLRGVGEPDYLPVHEPRL